MQMYISSLTILHIMDMKIVEDRYEMCVGVDWELMGLRHLNPLSGAECEEHASINWRKESLSDHDHLF